MHNALMVTNDSLQKMETVLSYFQIPIPYSSALLPLAVN
jgi:hypothetical protein